MQRSRKKKSETKREDRRSYKKLLSTLLLCRHGTGNHITGTFDEKKDGAVGPTLTGTYSNNEWHGGKGEAFRRVVRQLIKKKITPDLIVSSPQQRAIETSVFARLNPARLPDGKKLKDISFRILRKQGVSVHEQTKQLERQGNIIPSLKNAEKTWPNWDVISEDEGVLNEIERKLSDTPRQPPADPKGSALERAKKILDHFNSDKFKGKTILIIAHDGILRDIIRAHTGKKEYEDTFDFCEIRTTDGDSFLHDPKLKKKSSPKKAQNERSSRIKKSTPKNKKKEDVDILSDKFSDLTISKSKKNSK